MDDWTHEQLAAAVEAYRWMQQRTMDGLTVNKAQIYRDLAAKHGRTPKAWEYRMQNISHVLNQSDQKWIEGLRPAKNVGPEVTGTLLMLLAPCPPTAVSHATPRQPSSSSNACWWTSPDSSFRRTSKINGIGF